MIKRGGYEPKSYWNDRLSKSFDLTGVGYSKLGSAFNTWLYRRREHVVRDVYNDLQLTDPSILEIGCGTGYYIEMWKSLGIRQLSGLDIAAVSVERLRAQYPQYAFYCSDIAKGRVPLSGAFDLITLFDVIFHIVDDENYKKAVENMGRLAHAGSHVIMTDYAFKKQIFADKFGAIHFKPRTLSSHIKYFQQGGFELIAVKPVFFLMHPPLDVKHAISYMLGKLYWKAVETMADKWHASGKFIGPSLHYADQMIGKMKSITPSMKIMVFKKMK